MTVNIINVNEIKLIKKFSNINKNIFRKVTFSPNRQFIVTGSDDVTIALINLRHMLLSKLLNVIKNIKIGY